MNREVPEAYLVKPSMVLVPEKMNRDLLTNRSIAEQAARSCFVQLSQIASWSRSQSDGVLPKLRPYPVNGTTTETIEGKP